MARIPYVTADELSEEHAHLFSVDEENPDDIHNRAHQLMANDPTIFAAWSEWAWVLYDVVSDPRRRELVILTVARSMQNRYVWDQHVPMAIDGGLTREEIDAIVAGKTTPFSSDETALLEYVRAFVRGSVDEERHERLHRDYSSREIVSVGFLAGEYLRICRMLDAWDIDLAGDFIGWDLRQLSYE